MRLFFVNDERYQNSFSHARNTVQEAFNIQIDVIISYGVSINLTNVGKEDICCWKDGRCLKTDACKENEKRERSH